MEHILEKIKFHKTFRRFDGDLHDEDRVLEWLTSQDVFEIRDEIEEVNRRMLEKLLDENDFVAVYFCESKLFKMTIWLATKTYARSLVSLECLHTRKRNMSHPSDKSLLLSVLP